MAWLDQIIDTVRSGGNTIEDKVRKFTNLKKAKNIKQLAKKNTIVFPVLATNGISSDTMIVILKALEKTYVGFLQTILTQNNFVSAKEGNTGLVGLLGEAVQDQHVDLSFFVENWDSIHDASTKSINTDYNMNILNNLSLSKSLWKLDESYADDQAAAMMATAKMNNTKENIKNLERNIRNLEAIENQIMSQPLNTPEAHEALRTATANLASTKQQLTQQQNILSGILSTTNTHSLPKGRTSILDAEMKKYSAMQPTVLDVDVNYRSDDGSSMYSGHQAVAVKMSPHFTDSDEMLYRIKDVAKDKHVGFEFIRWSTGELSLFKDIILGIKNAKKRTTHDKHSLKMSKFWNRLYDGRNINVIKSTFGSAKKSLPTATLVITQDDAYRLKNEHGVDIRNKAIINTLFNRLLLFNFIIIDDSTGEVDMWDQEDQEYIAYKLDYIKKENDKSNDVVKSILDYTNRR